MEISSVNSLKRLNAKKKMQNLYFSFPQLSENENQEWQRKILRDYYANDIDSGTTVMLATILCVVAYTICRRVYGELLNTELQMLLGCIVLTFVLISIRKAFTFIRARVRLKKNMEELTVILSR